MKQFNLEKALAGEPVVLRNGKKAFIFKNVLDTSILFIFGLKMGDVIANVINQMTLSECGKSQRLALKIYLSRFVQKNLTVIFTFRTVKWLITYIILSTANLQCG